MSRRFVFVFIIVLLACAMSGSSHADLPISQNWDSFGSWSSQVFPWKSTQNPGGQGEIVACGSQSQCYSPETTPDPAYVLRFTYPEGMDDDGRVPGRVWTDLGPNYPHDIWIEYWFKYSPGFRYHPTVLKHFYFQYYCPGKDLNGDGVITADSERPPDTLNILVTGMSGSGRMRLSIAGGVYNYYQNNTSIPTVYLKTGIWYKIKWHIHLNTTSSNYRTQAGNGSIKMWLTGDGLNEALIMDYPAGTLVPDFPKRSDYYLSDGVTKCSDIVETFHYEPIYGGANTTCCVPADQWFYIDRTRLSDTDPGGSTTIPPSTKFFGNIFSSSSTLNAAVFSTWWDQITPEWHGKWGHVETSRDSYSWSNLDTMYSFASSNNVAVREHSLQFAWEDTGTTIPSFLAGLSDADIRAEVEEWIQDFCTRYPNTEVIDISTEAMWARQYASTRLPAYTSALGGLGSTGYDWVIWVGNKARQYCPNSKLIINDYITTNTYTASGWGPGDATMQAELLRYGNVMKSAGLLDGIGLEAHYLENHSAGYVKSQLDALATLGVPIYITEFDLNIADDTVQLEKMQELFPVFWEHPSVAGVTYWGYRQGHTWLTNAWLIRTDGTPRPALTWAKDYIGTSTETVPPEISNKYPTPDSTNWDVSNNNISFTVTDPSTVDSSTLTLGISPGVTNVTCSTGVSCSPSGDPTTLSVSYTVGGELSYSTTYTVNVTVSDILGNVQVTSWQFTTQDPPDTAAPALGTHTPDSGATDWPLNSWPIVFDISDAGNVDSSTLQFNIDGGATQTCGSGLSCTFINPNTLLRATYNHGSDWSCGTTYTANIPQVKDTAGNTLTTSWTFSTVGCPEVGPSGDYIIHIHED